MRYSKEQKEYIRNIAPGRYNDEIAELFNEKFGTEKTAGQIKSFKKNHNIRSNVPRKRVSDDDGLFTKEQKDFIKQNAKGRQNQELANLVNETFNLSITARQMKTWKNNHHLSSGLKGSEGMAPPNKGTKGVYNVGGNKTSFKKGHKPANYKPVGYEYVDRDGYVLVKVADKGKWPDRWKPKHKVIWEKKNGTVPKGYVVLFGDGNKRNFDPENLILVSKKQLATLNKKGLIANSVDLTRTGIMVADLYQKISERKKGCEI